MKNTIVIVYKNKNKIKMKTFYREIDEVLNPKTNLSGISENTEILDMGVGEKFIQSYSKKYKIKFEKIVAKRKYSTPTVDSNYNIEQEIDTTKRRGRPSNPNSSSQLKKIEREMRINSGEVLRRGRPKKNNQ
jgi:hypothetical protein